MIDFKGHRFEKDIILLCVRWYVAYPLSYRNLEEMREERGVEVDHSNLYRWVQKFTPPLEAVFRQGKKRPVGTRWRMDKTSITAGFRSSPLHWKRFSVKGRSGQWAPVGGWTRPLSRSKASRSCSNTQVRLVKS